MASQDNPENSLCATLKPPKSPPAAVDTLIFSPKNGHHPRIRRRAPFPDMQNGYAQGESPSKPQRDSGAVNPGSKHHTDKSTASDERHGRDGNTAPKYTIREKHTSKDYRSFPANMFGTAAVKMLEWLSPNGVESLVAKARSFDERPEAVTPPECVRSSSDPSQRRDSAMPSPKLRRASTSGQTSAAESHDAKKPHEAPRGDRSDANAAPDTKGEPGDSSKQRPPVASRPSNSNRNSNAKMRTPNSTKSKRKLSVESSIPAEAPGDEHFPNVWSPRFGPPPGDKNPRTLKNPNVIPRPISQTIGFFDGVPLEKMPPPPSTDHPQNTTDPPQVESRGNAEVNGATTPASTSESPPSEESTTQSPPSTKQNEADAEDELFPQALRSLNADVVNFVCDVLQEDGSTEPHYLEPKTVGSGDIKFASPPKSLVRKSSRRRHSIDAGRLKNEWRLFAEQSLFYVLSDAQALVRSFTTNGQIYDSQTLWYSMLRLTRTQPSLVLHSLWMAAELLFAPPKAIQVLRSPTTRVFPRQDVVLSNGEAGRLMSICLHALIATAPLVQEKEQLYEISRIRSHGVTLNRSGNRTSQEVELCLQYDEAFSNDLAMRLARRLFSAVTTRRYFDQVAIQNNTNIDDDLDHPDILAPLFAQLDFISMESAYVLNFALPQRGIHENRVPTLLLDWARTVMIQDWDGQADIPGDGPLGGALVLIEAICKTVAIYPTLCIHC